MIAKLQYLNLRILWLNDNPVADSEVLAEYVEKKSRIEMWNSKFTKHCTEWGLKYSNYKSVSAAANTENSKVYVLDLDDRNIFNIDQSLFLNFTNLKALSIKGHTVSNENELRIIIDLLLLPSIVYVYVDEEVEKVLRTAAE